MDWKRNFNHFKRELAEIIDIKDLYREIDGFETRFGQKIHEIESRLSKKIDVVL